MTSTASPTTAQRSPQWGLAVLGLVALIVGGVLAGFSLVHPGRGATLYTFGFSTVLEMKSYLTTAAAALVVVQVLSALAMWGKLPGVHSTPGWVSGLHRWSGTIAFVITVPVAFVCVWSIGFSTYLPRTLSHSILGCAFYGVFAAKMLALRMHRLPGWVIPVLGGALAAILTGLWFGSAFWFFTSGS
jgi:hypothetical protein